MAVTVTELIPCKYDRTWVFSEGLAPVELNGKCGFLSISEYVPANEEPAR